MCAFPESRRAALEGAILAARAAAASADPGDRLAAAARGAHHARPLLVSAEAADLRDAEEARTLAAAASRRDADASRTCVSLRVAFAEATFDLVAETVGEAAEFAAETWAQGDLIKTFARCPARSRRGRGGAARRARRAIARETARRRSGGFPGVCVFAARDARPRSPDTGASPWTRRSRRASKRRVRLRRRLSRRGQGGGARRVRRSGNASAARIVERPERRDRLRDRPRRFGAPLSERAPGNLGVGLLEGLPSRSRTAAKPARPVFVTDEAERAEALYESRRKKPSLRERLATSALAPTAAERDGDGRVRGGGGFAADPLDSWNADRGGFASYPADADEPDVGDAIVVDDDDEDDDEGFEILDRFGDAAPVARRRGLGPAVEDRLLAQQSPYERSLARARPTPGPR